MSDRQSYESRIADLKLKRFVSHYQPTYEQASNRDSGKPGSTDIDSLSPGQPEHSHRSAMSAPKGLKVDQAGMDWGSTMSVPKGLKVDQAGMVWGSNGVLLGNVQDDSLADLWEQKDYPFDDKKEALDEDAQKIGKKLAHGTSLISQIRSAHEHPYYKMEPDENGQYHCPYAALEDCWYKPQKLKFKFDEHLDIHLKPYRCDFIGCMAKKFSSTDCLLRHESEVHNMHGHGTKTHPVHSHNVIDLIEENTTPNVSESLSHGDESTYKLPDTSKSPRVRSSQSCKKGFEFLDTPSEPNHTVTSGPRYDSKLAAIPTSNIPEQSKEDDKKIAVDVDFLHKLESKINDLESRVEECEGRPGSPSNSSMSGSRDSVDSVSVLGHRSVRGDRNSRILDDDIIIFEPEEKEIRQGAVNVDEPSLSVARWKRFGEKERFEVVEEEGFSSRQVGVDLGNRPLLALVEEHRSNGKFWRKRLEIASPAFYELLGEVSCHNLNDIALHDGVFHLTEPFMVLFLNRKQLADYVENTKESTLAKEHAKFILDFLKSDFSDVSRMLDNFESVTPPNLVKYCDLWMLYRPGTMVYSHANGEWEAFIIDSLDGMQVRKNQTLTRLDIRAWSMNFDGDVYGRVWSIHCVAPFHGVKDISSLPLVPEKFLLDRKAIRESLLSRGKKFCTLQVQHCQHNEIYPSESSRVMVDHLIYQKRNGWLISIDGKYGPSSAKNGSWTDNKYSDWDTSGEAFDRRPRRYTPQRSLVRHFENEYCNRDYELESIDKAEDPQAEACRSYSTDRPSHVVVCEFEKYNLIPSIAEMDELSLILCPQHVRGFCFRDKVWKFFSVSQLKLVSFQDNAWDRLVLDEEYKDVLETMVSSHVDKVAGLRGLAGGKGLSILLHGEAGVGKTLTVESIAEHFGKPIFPVICSDIGTSVPKFDEKLEEISDYATKWGAILLFDEADVLLQARRDYECANLKRNDLVSSFVRFIEYYQGIVFITTNRVTKFDTALMPRIDMTLGLPPLDRDRRVEIWYNQFQDLFNKGIINASQSTALRTLVLEKWSKDAINGHQIKKVVKTADVLAEKKGRIVGQSEIETMLKLEREFEERVGPVDKEKEKKAGTKKDKEDLEEFEQVEKP